ncbi:neocarzinostatin family protein [Microbacterium sp. AG790]|uniref:neocarzinostatin apoprotein domain-containing protein n=1 Tax=Microbacterium sp. AG790 TaxID=2183995 RepID=UPI000EB178BD|nr:neocarzinostatin apoprotein domain-containing protein [Microbacterium sp. AG790]RKS93369.1 neocarzinostatin family protein [Microbacterium sp. AG790]
MSRTLRKRTIAASIAGLSLALVGLVGVPAFAATDLSPAPAVDAAGARYFVDGDATTTTVTGLAANTEYYVGLCANASYLFGIPACAGFQSVTTDAAGSLTATVVLQSNGANTHAKAPGQPASVDCTATDACAIKVATHGSNKQIVDESVSFRVDQ